LYTKNYGDFKGPRQSLDYIDKHSRIPLSFQIMKGESI